MRKPEVVIMKRDNVNAINALCLFAATAAAAAAAAVVVVVSHLKNRHNENSTLSCAARVKTVTLHLTCMNLLFHRVHTQ